MLVGPAAHAADRVRDITETVKASRDKHELPAMVAAVVEGDRVVAQGASGVRHRGDDANVSIDDKFHLGSDTKAMTATLCAMLVEEGKLSWDTTLAKAFPDRVEKMLAAWRDVTLEQWCAGFHFVGIESRRHSLVTRFSKRPIFSISTVT